MINWKYLNMEEDELTAEIERKQEDETENLAADIRRHIYITTKSRKHKVKVKKNYHIEVTLYGDLILEIEKNNIYFDDSDTILANGKISKVRKRLINSLEKMVF